VSAQFAKDVHKAAQFTLAAFVEGSEDLDLVEGCLGSVWSHDLEKVRHYLRSQQLLVPLALLNDLAMLDFCASLVPVALLGHHHYLVDVLESLVLLALHLRFEHDQPCLNLLVRDLQVSNLATQQVVVWHYFYVLLWKVIQSFCSAPQLVQFYAVFSLWNLRQKIGQFGVNLDLFTVYVRNQVMQAPCLNPFSINLSNKRIFINSLLGSKLPDFLLL
jgi:hypothetical protein